jgi:hypothetical protein
VSNAIVFYVVSVYTLTEFAMSWLAPVTLLLAAIHFVKGVVVTRLRSDGILALASFAISTALLTLWIALEFPLEWQPALWAVEGSSIVAAGHLLGSSKTKGAGRAVLGLAFVALMGWTMMDPFEPSRLLVTEDGLVFGVHIAALSVTCVLDRRRDAHDQPGLVAGVAANLVALTWLSLEAKAAIDRHATFPDSQIVAFTYSAIWALYAGALLSAGVRARIRWMRLLAASILAATLGKLVVHDLWLVAPLHRIVSFIGIGVLMLLCSLMYHRFKQFILGLPDGDASHRSRRRSPPGGRADVSTEDAGSTVARRGRRSPDG